MSSASEEGLNRVPSTAAHDTLGSPDGATSKEHETRSETTAAARRRVYEAPRLSRIVLAQSDPMANPKNAPPMTRGSPSSPNVSGATVFGW